MLNLPAWARLILTAAAAAAGAIVAIAGIPLWAQAIGAAVVAVLAAFGIVPPHLNTYSDVGPRTIPPRRS